MPLKKIISFGYKHEWPPVPEPGVVIVDVRQEFRNPFHNKRLRYKRGVDIDVQDDIRKTPNFDAKVQFVKDQITQPGTDVAYIGCHGGHHRSVFLAELLAKDLGVAVEHRDIQK